MFGLSDFVNEVKASTLTDDNLNVRGRQVFGLLGPDRVFSFWQIQAHRPIKSGVVRKITELN
jgi:hypothetical protein